MWKCDSVRRTHKAQISCFLFPLVYNVLASRLLSATRRELLPGADGQNLSGPNSEKHYNLLWVLPNHPTIQSSNKIYIMTKTQLTYKPMITLFFLLFLGFFFTLQSSITNPINIQENSMGYYPFSGLGYNNWVDSEPILIIKVIGFSLSSFSPSLIGWAGQVLQGNYSRSRLTKTEKNHMITGISLKKANSK